MLIKSNFEAPNVLSKQCNSSNTRRLANSGGLKKFKLQAAPVHAVPCTFKYSMLLAFGMGVFISRVPRMEAVEIG